MKPWILGGRRKRRRREIPICQEGRTAATRPQYPRPFSPPPPPPPLPPAFPPQILPPLDPDSPTHRFKSMIECSAGAPSCLAGEVAAPPAGFINAALNDAFNPGPRPCPLPLPGLPGAGISPPLMAAMAAGELPPRSTAGPVLPLSYSYYLLAGGGEEEDDAKAAGGAPRVRTGHGSGVRTRREERWGALSLYCMEALCTALLSTRGTTTGPGPIMGLLWTVLRCTILSDTIYILTPRIITRF